MVSKREVLGRIAEITGVEPKFHEVDLRDFEAVRKVLEGGEFQTVMHFAGLKAVGESVEQPLTYYENNVGGTINLLRAMRIAGVNQIVFSSSATVYGEQEVVEYDETMTTGMINAFSATGKIPPSPILSAVASFPSYLRRKYPTK